MYLRYYTLYIKHTLIYIIHMYQCVIQSHTKQHLMKINNIWNQVLVIILEFLTL